MEIKKPEETVPQKNKFESMRAILIIIFFICIVFGVWFFLIKTRTPGGNTNANTSVQNQNANNPVTPSNLINTSLVRKDSFYRNYVKIYSTVSAGETDPRKEYIEVRVTQPNLSNVDISGWKLYNSKGEFATIGDSISLPVGGKVNPTSSTKVKGGDSLIISTGSSPVGVSFRVNSCTGYFEQFQDFIPSLLKVCPQTNYDAAFQNLERDCQDFVRNIPNCMENTNPFPPKTSALCKTYVASKINYNACVDSNRLYPDFYKPEWRIFLGRDTELWAKSRETITLIDEKGYLIDSVSY